VADTDGPLDADHRRIAEPDVEAVVARQRRLDDFLLHLAVERQGEFLSKIILAKAVKGSCSASCVSATYRAPFSEGRSGSTIVSNVGGSKNWAVTPRGTPSSSPIRTSLRPHTLAI
jgi:hypothetical protein